MGYYRIYGLLIGLTGISATDYCSKWSQPEKNMASNSL